MPTIAEFVVAIQDDGSVLVSDFRSEVGAHKAAATTVQTTMPGSEVVEDPWAGSNATNKRPAARDDSGLKPPAERHAQPEATAPIRYCQHGPMKFFPQGKYGPFYACQLDRNDPNKCKTQKA